MRSDDDSRSGQRRPRRRILIRAVLLLLGLWMVAALVVGAFATLRANAGEADLRSAVDAFLGQSPTSEVRNHIDRARSNFAQAGRWARSPVLTPLRVVPLLGHQVRTFERMTGAASRVAEIADEAVAEAPEMDGAGDQDRIELAEEVGALARRTAGRLAEVDPGPGDWLLPPLSGRHAALAEELERLRTTAQRGAVVGERLGSFLRGPRRYLLLAANNAEMRVGSGMFLSAGVLSVEGARLTLGPMSPTAQMTLDPGVGVGGDLEDLWGDLDPGREWRNVNLTPRFPVSAELASRMWQARTGEGVDGVLAVDAMAVRALLRATGPVSVDGREIAGDDAVQEILHDQYEGVPYTVEGRTERRDRIDDLARGAVGRLDRGRWRLGALAWELARAAGGRHILAWAPDASEQDLWEAAGVDGRMRTDSLMLGVANRAGNKLDQFLEVSSTIRTRSAEEERTEVSLEIVLENTTPRGEPRYIAGPHPLADVPEGTYQGVLAITLPGAARQARIEGARLALAGEDGPNHVVAATVTLARGARQTVTVRFTLPGTHGEIRVEPSARTPPVSWRHGSDSWDDGKGANVVW